MPIYEYECVSKRHRFEVIQKFDDPPVVHCTVCGEPVQKLLSSSAIQFKGSGWYITDYARKGNPGPNISGEKGGTEKAASSSDSKGTANSSSEVKS